MTTTHEFTSAQMALIEENRDWNVRDTDWWDYTYEYWVEKLAEKGINIDQKTVKLMNGKTRGDPAIYFSGFNSQGDGACFEASLDMKKFIEAHDLAKDFPAAAFFAERSEIYCQVTSTGHYSNSGNTTIDVTDFVCCTEDDGSLREAQYEVMEQEYNAGLLDFERAVKDICRGYMDDIYEALEQEYDYLTSDEAVWESLVDNDMTEEDEEDDEESIEEAARHC
jgi:ferredoxin